jgi:hypothetical protein
MLHTGHHFKSVYIAHDLLFKIQYSTSELNRHHKSETAAAELGGGRKKNYNDIYSYEKGVDQISENFVYQCVCNNSLLSWFSGW